MKKTGKPPAKKFFFRVSWDAWELLEKAKKEAGFASMYELGQCVIACYIRYLREKNHILPPEEENQFLNDEARKMCDVVLFEEFKMQVVQPKRIPSKAESQRYLNRIGKYKQLDMFDIAETERKERIERLKPDNTFQELSEGERHFEFIKPKRNAPNATLDSGKICNTPQFTPLRRFARAKEFKSISDYACDTDTQCAATNEQNKAFIDRWVSENYERLNSKFSDQREVINSSGCGSIDKLNDALKLLYTDPDLHLTSWEQAKAYLNSKFTDAAIRIPMQKPVKAETEDNEIDND